MNDVRIFTALPMMRCCMPIGNPASGFCGSPAVSMRKGPTYYQVEYFCTRHCHDGDIPIAGERLLRRVTVRMDVLLAAVTWAPQTAQAEAVDTISQAIERIGGLINLVDVTSEVGRWTPPAPPGRGNGALRGR